jgi:hypothetical protein
MRVKVQLVMCSDDGQEETVTDVVTLQKDAQRIEHLVLTLRQAKQLLNTIQHRVLRHQVEAFLASHATCTDCGTARKVKGYHTRSFRTLFGTFKLASPRLFYCRCKRRKTTSFRPLSALLTESVAPELLLMETKWASLVLYGLTVDALTAYITNNRHLIPNYGERYRHGEAIATGFVESTVNQVVSKRFCKRQQMQWSKRGAHVLLQTRVETLNRELGFLFKRWYPDLEVEEIPDAASSPGSPYSPHNRLVASGGPI